MIKNEVRQSILDAAHIEDVVGEFVALKKRGANYIGLCPFHNEKTPSFSVSPSKGIYKCFGCGKAGNAVSFIMEYEHCNYNEALRFLAAKYNITIEDTPPTPEEIAKEQLADKLFNINNFAQKYFTENLLHNDIGKAIGLSYFHQRGITDNTIDDFQLGYSLDRGDALVKYCKEHGYGEDVLIQSGLAIEPEHGNIYDRFRSRVIFPIHSPAGRVIGFGGRIMSKDKAVAKYVNTPETAIYHKSKTLYGIFRAKKSIISKDFCYLVEGYMDVITMYQAGFTNVVASSGTSLTSEQIQMIRRYTQNIVVVYDGDSAGIHAALRGIDMILEAGMKIRVLLLPENEDPDSFIRNNRISDVTEYFETQVSDFISFKTNLLLKGVENDPIKKADVIKDITASIAAIPDIIQREIYIKECSRRLDISEESLIFEINKILVKKNKNLLIQPVEDEKLHIPQKTTEQEDNAMFDELFDYYEFSIIEKLVLYGDKVIEIYDENDNTTQIYAAQFIIDELAANKSVDDDIDFKNPLYRKILDMYTATIEAGNVPGNDMLVHSEDNDVVKVVADILSKPYNISPHWSDLHIHVTSESNDVGTTVRKTMYNYLSSWLKQKRRLIQKNIKDAPEEQIETLLLEDMKYKQLEMKINQELNRVIVG